METAIQMPMTTSLESSGGRLVTADGRTLPLRGAVLRAEARAGLARVVLEQRFANPYKEPLSVTYLMPLPSDGAVSGYAFTIGARRVVGEVDRRAAARERYEEAIAEGRSAALVEQERSSLFTQQIGNIPPGAEIVAELTIDQKLRWLDEGAWEWRFPTVVMPRYQGAPGRVEDAPRILVDVADAPLPPRVTMELLIRDAIAGAGKPESPSHALGHAADGTVHLAADGGARLDRDVVVRWPVAQAQASVTLDVARPAADKPHAAQAYGLVTLVPPSPRDRKERPVARDLCLLIDTSGSMGGEPLDQARRVLTALVDGLRDEDTLEMIEFSNRPRRWKKEPVRASEAARKEARKWLAALHASGGTEMRAGLMEALAPLRAESQRQIVLVSDGAIGFETEIVADILKQLPPGSRVHTVGVGSGVNRSLTQPAARAGRGIEVIVGLGEDPERAAQRICARTVEPMLVDVQLSGSALLSCAPARLPDLFRGAPALLSLALKPEGGELHVRARGAAGEWQQRLVVPPAPCGSGNGAVTALYGRELVEDLEMRHCAAGEDWAAIDRQLERTGLEFQIATRLTSWLAVDSEVSVDPTRPSRKERIPHELPYGVCVEGLGLRACSAPPTGMIAPAPMQMMSPSLSRTRSGFAGAGAPPASPPPPSAMRPGAPPKASSAGGAFRGALDRLGGLFKKEADGGRADDDIAGEVTEAGAPPAPPASPASPASEEAEDRKVIAATALRGRVVKLKGRELIVEIEVPGELDWILDGEAWIEDDAGGLTRGDVDARRSTATQRVARGQTLRLTLQLPADLPAPPSLIRIGAFRIEV